MCGLLKLNWLYSCILFSPPFLQNTWSSFLYKSREVFQVQVPKGAGRQEPLPAPAQLSMPRNTSKRRAEARRGFGQGRGWCGFRRGGTSRTPPPSVPGLSDSLAGSRGARYGFYLFAFALLPEYSAEDPPRPPPFPAHQRGAELTRRLRSAGWVQ